MRPPISRYRIVAAITIVISIAAGITFFVHSHAATPFLNYEAEAGAVAGGVTRASDAAASGGAAVEFRAANTSNTAGYLPFVMPSAASLRNSSKLVFAHYWPPMPISVDNKDAASDYYANHYLNPSGEFASSGGLTRERPLIRPVITDTGTTNIGKGNYCGSTGKNIPVPNWRIRDMETNVRQAIAGGLDGFTLDQMQMPGDADYNNCVGVYAMLQAAHNVDPGFKIALMPDMSGSFADKTADQLADYVADLAGYPSSYHLADGRLVVAPFYPEKKHDANWWKDWIALMKSKHNITIAFVPCFLNYGANYANFAPISYGLSYWGPASTAELNSSNANYATQAHGLGKIFMQPVRLQDIRPRDANFFEASNTETYRGLWGYATDKGADWVQIPTWNDYTEEADIAPSTHIGWSPLDIGSYFVNKFKTGNYPTISKDVLYVSHRIQPVSAKPTGGQTSLMTVRTYSTPARDTVEVLSFLKEAATITVKVGANTYTYNAPAGMHAKTEPLATGTISATAVRSGSTVATVSSPFTVTNSPVVQDMQYHFVSSSRTSGIGSYNDYQ